jgi:hypothetical protein
VAITAASVSAAFPEVGRADQRAARALPLLQWNRGVNVAVGHRQIMQEHAQSRAKQMSDHIQLPATFVLDCGAVMTPRQHASERRLAVARLQFAGQPARSWSSCASGLAVGLQMFMTHVLFVAKNQLSIASRLSVAASRHLQSNDVLLLSGFMRLKNSRPIAASKLFQ